jgi:DNA-binding beta-propeller fold protein YncE
VAVDPGSNLAVVANQSDDSVSVFSLGAALQPVSIIETYPKEFTVSSTLQGVAPPSALTLTVIGKGLAGNPLSCSNGSTTAKVRLDGVPLTTTCIGSGDRELTAIVPPSLLTSARRYALDVLSPDGTTVSNATDFTVSQSVDVTNVCSTPPLPAGVAIDPVLNYALVSLSGCNRVAVIDLSTGVGTTFLVGTNPLGVAILPRLSTAVVANNQSGNATVLDYVHSKLTTITTGASPIGVAANQDMGTAAVANSVANTVSVLTVANSGAVSIPTGQRPVAVAYDYQTNQIAAAAAVSNSVGIASASSTALNTSFSVNLPSSIAYDPWNNDFLAASSSNNSVTIYDPTTQLLVGSLLVGINPTAIAFNSLTGTLVSTNTGSNTITVADILNKEVRAVLSLRPPPVNSNVALSGAPQFAVDIHPLTNLAVIADTANGSILLVPLPR